LTPGVEIEVIAVAMPFLSMKFSDFFGVHSGILVPIALVMPIPFIAETYSGGRM